MKFGVLVFPGSNCDHDTHHVIGGVMGHPVTYLWHESHDLEGCDAILVPGGFAYGDYLRTGAIARFAPVMQSVRRFAESGGLVMGICNGFQILCEAGLLPGALRRNAGLHFVCRHVNLKLENSNTPFTSELDPGRVLSILVCWMQGRTRPCSISQRGSGNSATRVPSMCVGLREVSKASGLLSAGRLSPGSSGVAAAFVVVDPVFGRIE